MRSVTRGLTSIPFASLIGPLAVALALLVLLVNEMGVHSVASYNAERENALETRNVVGRLRRLLLVVESSQRGYLLTGRTAYRQPYDSTLDDLNGAIADVRALADRRPAQRDTLLKVADVAASKVSETQEVVRLFDTGDRSNAMALFMTDIGRDYMEQVTHQADEINLIEAQAFDAAGRQRDRMQVWARLGLAAMVALCLAAVFAMQRLSRDRERERVQHLLALQAERDKLETEVDRRTHELVDLAKHLQSVREDERHRLARELHDELGGLLTAAKLDVARMRKRLVEATPEVNERILHLTKTLDEGIALKRRIIEDLHPSSLNNLGLQRTLEILCVEFAQRSEIAVHTEIDDVQMAPDRALAIYRLVQEALTNIAKYASAHDVHVTLRREGDQVRVQVKDDGLGFDPAHIRQGAHGLAGMRFRVRSCQGELTLHSSPGEGTTVQATMPV
ncbi:MAG TPA: CHASE3 domain-containing protein [Ideonella sp.]|uniref:CHASE3 domain-containing protein n=1 Tax=Ideonella sp. TaxID=1929293 RepID=UPI002C808AEB|nr:CHASE3 domain-containing protein [Ideonella sp.]HSI49587.1 CHASE3 domain-containing protein [Ideonella sp.]